MNSPTPAAHEIARALLERGANEDARDVFTTIAARGRVPAEAGQLMDAVAAGRPLPPADEPGPTLDITLARALAEEGRFIEARAVVRGADLHRDGAGARLTELLDEALSPFPDDADPSFAAAQSLIRAGRAASAGRALEALVRQEASPPPWLLDRVRALWVLLGGAADSAASPPVASPQPTREAALARVRARDLPGALEAARAANATDLAEVLERLVRGTEGLLEGGPRDEDDSPTIPIHGHRLAEMHVRMGVLDQADRAYRSLLKAEPGDERAWSRLSDVLALRRALGESPEPAPPRPKTNLGWLKKNAPRPSAGGWSAGRAVPRSKDEAEDQATGVIEPAAEAELLFKLGKAQAALDIYRLLAIRHPEQRRYQLRIREIEAMIARDLTPIAAEATSRSDPRTNAGVALPTDPSIRLPLEGTEGDEEDDEMTLLEVDLRGVVLRPPSEPPDRG